MIDPTRQQPEQFFYDEVQPVSNWNPTPGFYTRYGDVRPLVQTMRTIACSSWARAMKLTLEFSPPLARSAAPAGRATFLLLVDGWAKDADANTAFSNSVLPLPFHGMSAYPYRRQEHFPNDPPHAHTSATTSLVPRCI